MAERELAFDYFKQHGERMPVAMVEALFAGRGAATCYIDQLREAAARPRWISSTPHTSS